MATGRHRIARDKEIYIFPDKTLEFNPGDSVPPIIEVDRAAESLEGGPVFEGTDVPVEYVHYYLNVRNLYTFLSDYPSVSPEQALTAIEERLLEDIDALINSDREYARRYATVQRDSDDCEHLVPGAGGRRSHRYISLRVLYVGYA